LRASSKPPPNATPLDRGDCRDRERLDGAVRQIDLGHEGAKPVYVLTGPFPHLAAEAEVRSFCFDQHNADIAFTRVVDSLPKTFREPQVEPVERRIGKNDAPDGVVAFEPETVCMVGNSSEGSLCFRLMPRGSLSDDRAQPWPFASSVAA
jgi:hypothetical protein